ncbi:MAG TPA: L-threonylcarbamoyladenylate synthase [Actinomycetota bacterium]|nr:L-threonylcarbamoyladenylate synthase [Actinomycetota bacterium]
MTEVLRVDAETPDPAVVEHAASVLRAGGTVAFPTETVYGVGATALDASAVRRVFEAKGRPPEDPLIVHLAAEDGVHLVARDVLAIAHTLVRRFWPGPLTLVLPRRPEVPAEVTAGLDTVAVRMPAHHVALAMIEAARAPVAAPSANRFGRASPTTAQHVLDDLEGRIDLVLDAGPTSVGLESTVLDLTREVPTILRPGGVAREEIERVVGMVEVSGSTAGPAPSPGMLESHYAVAPELVVVECPDARATPEVLAEMTSLARRYGAAGRGVAIAAASDDVLGPDAEVSRLGSSKDLDEVAHNLFAVLRSLEAGGAEVIVSRSFGEAGLGLAIGDRLRRAAAQIVVPSQRPRGPEST